MKRRSMVRRWWRLAILFVSAGLAVPLLYLTGLCAWLGIWHLSWVFLALVALVSVPAAWLLSRRKRVRIGLLGLAGASGVILVWLALPGGAAPRDSRALQACSVTGVPVDAPWFGGIPELEVVLLGGRLGLSAEERGATHDLALLRDLYAGPDALACGPSVLLDSWIFDRGHYWLVLPPAKDPAPLLIFLHGNGGNFLAYPKLLVRQALKERVAVAMPTLGWGNWSAAAGQERALAVLDDVLRRHPQIDRGRVFIGGISAGAIGALELFSKELDSFRGVVCISGVPETYNPPPPIDGKEVLIVHGSLDTRIPVSRSRALVDELRAGGADVQYLELPDAGHLALLTHRGRVLGRIFAMLRRHRP